MKLLTIHTYLPQDRLRAIANNTTLPDRASGSVLFADISGFTALTESLRKTLGARQGAEELTKQLGKVYSALIAEIEKYGGSVIGFAGDSMLCWFNDIHGSSSMRATNCAFAMQVAINEFPALALKVAIASGDARRFIVGNEEIQKIDVLAGSTVTRTAKGEHLAEKGDVLLDEITANTLQDSIFIKEWREDGDEKFAVVEQGVENDRQNLEIADSQTITPVMQALKPYVHHAVYERETSGQGTFLTEFRPCTALFIRFMGIDYDSDSAEAELDAFIHEVQHTASRHDGTLMDITIGDKGSYVYVNFGALSAHEDNSLRAVKTALELRNKTELQLQMGITQGLMRVGPHGGTTRKTFGALGDDVNLAARLMTTAKENEILLSGHVHKAVVDKFTFEPRPPLPMKGKAEPLPVFTVTGKSQKRAVRLQEPNYSLPMVGRQAELKLIEEKLDLAAQGKSQIIGIVAEAGMGKSRLVAEVIRSARRKGFVGYGGACQSDGIHTPYLAWKPIWQAFFDVDPSAPLRKQIRDLESDIAESTPENLEALPLLGTLLDLDIPDNEFTQTLEPQSRQSVLRVLLSDCLHAAAKEEPLLIVVEDLHWIDAISHDLLEQLAKVLQDSPICFVLAYRPPQLMRLKAPRLEAMPSFTKVELAELDLAEGEQAIRAKLAQLYPARGGAMPNGLVDKLMARSQGNPFYLEELLNYVRDRGLDPADLEQIELPDSLHSLVLSRIDQLSEHEKTTLRAASIVGRLFHAKWLTGYYPDLGSFLQVKTALDELDNLDITPLDSPEPELVYLFKHIVTHEVTYDSLPFATRTKLHEQLAVFLEGIGASVETIAFHYGHSQNTSKQQEYWLKAGNAAYQTYANEAALEYFERLGHLDSQEAETDLNHKRAGAYFALGRYNESRKYIHMVLDGLGQSLPSGWRLGIDLIREIISLLGRHLSLTGRQIIDDNKPNIPTISTGRLKLIQVYLLLGFVDAYADTASIVDLYINLRALNISEIDRRRSPELAQSYSSVGYVFGVLGLHWLAQYFYRHANDAIIGLENLPTTSWIIQSVNGYLLLIGDWQAAGRGFKQAYEISTRLGDQSNAMRSHAHLIFTAYFQGDFAHVMNLAFEYYKEGLANNHLEAQIFALVQQSWILLQLGQSAQALSTAKSILPILDKINSPLGNQLTYSILAVSYLKQDQYEQAQQAASDASALLAQASLPVYSHILSWSSIAQVYLTLWENEITRNTKSIPQFKVLAQQACKSLNRLKSALPIAQPEAWLWQGLYNWLDGKHRRAHVAWQKSLLAARKLSMPYDEALAYYEIGRHATGAEREENLARANEIFERLGVDTSAGI